MNGTDWKATREKLYKKIEEFNAWVAQKVVESKTYTDEIKALTKQMFSEMWNDGHQYWEIIKEFFAWLGRIINWKQWKWVYIAITVIVLGMILHYVFGV